MSDPVDPTDYRSGHGTGSEYGLDTPATLPRPPIFPAEWLTPRFDLVAHIHRQRSHSEKTFGPISRKCGVVPHIRKELEEIEAKPDDLEEWIDVVILAMDGAWRAGYEPEEIVAALVAKQTKNEARKWPDWRTVPEGAPIEHDRSAEGKAAPFELTEEMETAFFRAKDEYERMIVDRVFPRPTLAAHVWAALYAAFVREGYDFRR